MYRRPEERIQFASVAYYGAFYFTNLVIKLANTLYLGRTHNCLLFGSNLCIPYGATDVEAHIAFVTFMSKFLQQRLIFINA